MGNIDPFIKELFDDHRKYLIDQCNLIATTISDKDWMAVKHHMSRHIKYSTNPASLVKSIISPCGFVPATFPILFGSHLQLPVQYIISPVEEHSTVAEFIYRNPIWTMVANGQIPNVGHRLMLRTEDSCEIRGLIYLSGDLIQQFDGKPQEYWEQSLAMLKINNLSHTYYGENNE